ncbi:hypothetical protein GCM10017687_01890 [Streptomyces echinatus]
MAQIEGLHHAGGGRGGGDPFGRGRTARREEPEAGADRVRAVDQHPPGQDVPESGDDVHDRRVRDGEQHRVGAVLHRRAHIAPRPAARDHLVPGPLPLRAQRLGHASRTDDPDAHNCLPLRARRIRTGH